MGTRGANSGHKIEILSRASNCAGRITDPTNTAHYWSCGPQSGAKPMTPLARFLLSCLLISLSPSLAWAELTVGTMAPAFSAKAAKGGTELTFTLTEALKKGPVVVYFYPKSFTSVCTEEAHLSRGGHAGVRKTGRFGHRHLGGLDRDAARVLTDGMPRQIPSCRRSQWKDRKSLRRRSLEPGRHVLPTVHPT